MHIQTETRQQPYVATAATYQLDAYRAARELAKQIDNPEFEYILFFCSAAYDLPRLGEEMEKAFPGRKVMGCTTAGEVTDHGYGKSSISALGFSNEVFTVEALVKPLSDFSLLEAQNCVAKLVDGIKARPKAPVSGNTFVMTLIDGLSPQEEHFLVTLDTALGRIPHFGGSAGDDENLANTHVYYNGAFHNDSAIIIMVNTLCPFEVFTTHHIESLDRKLVVTKADCDQRRIYELNAEPAAEVYAREVGIPLADLRPEVYALHPLAVLIGDEYYVRSIQKVNDDLSLNFYCAVDDGIVLTAMRPGDLLGQVETKLTELEQKLGSLEMVLGCDCFLRRLEIEQRHATHQVARLFSRFRLVGFNTYGEQLNGIHMNQTLTGVMIGRPAESVVLPFPAERKAG